MRTLRSLAVTVGLFCILSAANAPAQDTMPPSAPVSPAKSAFSEDWTTLSIRSLNLQAEPPVITEHDVRPGYTRDLVRVAWRPGDSIELFVYVPRGVSKAPAVLYLYSYPADVDRFFDEGWATRATANGYAAVGFVSALTGQRYHTRPMREWFVSELQESLGTTVYDVQMILDYLAARGDIDMSRIGMFGQGSGGAIAILAASVDSRIQALDLLDPWGDWPDWLQGSAQVPDSERSSYLTPEFLKSVSRLDPVDVLPRLSLRSLRLQQILSDPVTPRNAMDRIAAAVPSTKNVFRYPDTEAHFQALHVSGVSGWLKEQLALPAPPVSSARNGQE